MKKIKVLVLVVFLFCLLTQNYVFSAIESRIQGKIIDSDTNDSIVDAMVFLYKNGEFFSLENTVNTNANGEFVFNNLTQGIYCVAVIKDGYAAQGPFFSIMDTDKDPGFYKVNETKKVKFITLGEGKIKHLIIKIEKEAVLEIAVFKKDEKGLSPAKRWIQFNIYPEDYFDHFDLFETNGHVYTSKYLGAGKVKAVISTEGVQSKVYDNIVLEKGKKTAIEYIIDFTTGPIVYGVITDKDTGNPICGVDVSIWKEDEKSYSIDTQTNENGEYKIALKMAGVYTLWIASGGADTEKEFTSETLIVIKANEKIHFDKSF